MIDRFGEAQRSMPDRPWCDDVYFTVDSQESKI